MKQTYKEFFILKYLLRNICGLKIKEGIHIRNPNTPKNIIFNFEDTLILIEFTMIYIHFKYFFFI